MKSDVKNVLVDWFQFTIFMSENNLEAFVYNFFGLDLNNHYVYKLDSGQNGYSQSLIVYGKIRCMNNPKRPEMGINCIMSGSACREFELRCDWFSLFNMISLYKHNINRIDIAIDYFEQYFTIDMLLEKTKRKELITKFKKVNYMESFQLQGDLEKGSSITFGTQSSDLFIQFYDKLQERKVNAYTVDSDITFWNRCELRFRHKNADVVYNYLLHNFDRVGEYVFSVLNNYLRFINLDHKKISQCSTCSWWLRFVNTTDQLKIAPIALQTSIQRKESWLKSQMAVNFGLMYFVDNSYYKELLRIGYDKLTKEDLEPLNTYLIESGQSIITLEEVKKELKQFADYSFKFKECDLEF